MTGVIGADVHTIGIKILEYALSKAGFQVASLGVQTSQEEFIEAAVETVRAFEAGVLDSLVAPFQGLKNQILVVRDAQGAMRYLDHGNLPLPPEAVEYNRERIGERARRERREADYEMLIDDIQANAEGGLLLRRR